MSDGREYPYDDGGFTILGPECFANPEGTVISWKGANYYQACDHKVADLDDGGASYCVKRVNHPGIRHEDYDGNTYDEVYGTNPERIEIPIPTVGMLEDGTAIQVTKLHVRAAYDLFIKPMQDAKQPLSDEQRTIAAIMRAVNESLPTEAPSIPEGGN